jgi:uncharacterized membrane protein YeaQ/YmgE (transglycosylase-associated protein family)
MKSSKTGERSKTRLRQAYLMPNEQKVCSISLQGGKERSIAEPSLFPDIQQVGSTCFLPLLLAFNLKETYMELLWFLLIGLIAGWLAGAIVGGGYGIVGDIVVGIVGAFLGGFLFRTLGISAGGGMLGTIIVATVGAIVLLLLLRLFRRAR